MHGTFHALVQLLALALDGLDLCSEATWRIVGLSKSGYKYLHQGCKYR